MMLNYATVIGTLSEDPRLEKAEGGDPTVWFHVEVERDDVPPNSPATDRILCVARGYVVKFISAYFKKGKPIVLEGRLESFHMRGPNDERLLGMQLNVLRARFQETDYPPQNGRRSYRHPQNGRGYR